MGEHNLFLTSTTRVRRPSPCRLVPAFAELAREPITGSPWQSVERESRLRTPRGRPVAKASRTRRRDYCAVRGRLCGRVPVQMGGRAIPGGSAGATGPIPPGTARREDPADRVRALPSSTSSGTFGTVWDASSNCWATCCDSSACSSRAVHPWLPGCLPPRASWLSASGGSSRSSIPSPDSPQVFASFGSSCRSFGRHGRLPPS